MNLRLARYRLQHALEKGEPFYVSTEEWEEIKGVRPALAKRPDLAGIWNGEIGAWEGVRVVVDDLTAAALDITLSAYWESS